MTDQELNAYDGVVVNSSGGKDSQTALRYIATRYTRPDQVWVSHQDLGEMEWEGSRALAQVQADHYGLRFEVSRYRNQKGEELSLLDYVLKRGKWMDNKNRYCTSDFKRGPGLRVVTMFARWLRAEHGIEHPRILNVFGFRAEESPNRRKKPELEKNVRAWKRAKWYELFDYLPIQQWTEEQVWDDIRPSKVPYHLAYDLGMPRLSCVMCFYAPRGALVLAARFNKPLFERYLKVEKATGHRFTDKLALADIRDEVYSHKPIESSLTGAWNM